MWSQFLNESRSQRKFDNRSLVILGSKHSGKRSLVDSLFDIAKTTLYGKRQGGQNKMRLKGATTAIDYAYLNVMDMHDPDNRTHAKLQVYMVEQVQPASIYSELAQPLLLANSVFVIMLDFTSPWNFVVQFEKWVRFINELQQKAQLPIHEIDRMAAAQVTYYKGYRQPEFDESGRMKLGEEQFEEEQQALDLPEGVLLNNVRVPLVVCVNKCDLQSQVLREESSGKIQLILYHLRSLCVKYGAALIYTSIRSNSNLGLFYQYVLHRSYGFPLRFKPDAANEQAIFIPFGFDSPRLIADSMVKIDVSRSYEQVIPAPVAKKVTKEEVQVEEDSKFFEKYINQSQIQSSAASTTLASEKEIEKQPYERKQAEVTDFFKNLLSGGGTTARRETLLAKTTTTDQSQRLLNAEKELMKHTAQVLEKKNLDQE